MIIRLSGILTACLLLVWLMERTPEPKTGLHPHTVFTAAEGKAERTEAEEKNDYWPSQMCRDCHRKIYDQHSRSMHAASFENPVFQAVYFKHLLPCTFRDTSFFMEAESCIACHSPLSYIRAKGPVISREQVDGRTSGVTCDLCHTLKGYKGVNPGGGNFISEPGTQKLGPFKHKSNWHHEYSELQTRSEFCGICHRRVNRNGLEIISTYTEWKDSRYAQEGIQCQDCHMNVNGFLSAGKPEYESGKAAQMTLGYSPDRDRLYTHRFPGAHSRTEVEGALRLDIEVSESIVSPGDDIGINLYIDNARTGHKMPTGSAELRMVYIEMTARNGDKAVSVSAAHKTEQMFDVTGDGEFDARILGDGFPAGRRVYRAVLVDKMGQQTLFSYDAEKVIFDNRLKARETRKETYRFRVPEDAEGSLHLEAVLFYLRYPDTFADQFGFPRSKAVEIARAEKIISITR